MNEQEANKPAHKYKSAHEACVLCGADYEAVHVDQRTGLCDDCNKGY